MERDLVEYIVKSLVDNPDAVDIKVIEGEKSTILELRVAESDVGKVIGKTAESRVRFGLFYPPQPRRSRNASFWRSWTEFGRPLCMRCESPCISLLQGSERLEGWRVNSGS